MTFELFSRIAFFSMIPVTELRATIPIFLARHPELPVWFIFVAAVFGNMIPNLFLLWFLPRITNWLHDHVAPLINSTVFWLHDFIVKGKRILMIYALIVLLTIGALYGLRHFKVEQTVYYLSVLFGIPVWSYLMFKVAEKAYQSALDDKSIIHWFYSKVTKEHGTKFMRNGAIALVLIVGIPVPGTGSWTGSLLAFLFNIPYWKALGLIFLGVLMAATIVTGISTGILEGLSLF